MSMRLERRARQRPQEGLDACGDCGMGHTISLVCGPMLRGEQFPGEWQDLMRRHRAAIRDDV